MSQQPPDNDPPPETPPEPASTPQPDGTTPSGATGSDLASENARVPWESAPTPPLATSPVPTSGWVPQAAPVAPPVWGGTPAPAGEGSAVPPVGWATPVRRAAREVPGASGLSFADTAPRVVGFVVDWFLVAVVAGIIAGSLGYGRTTSFGSGSVTDTSYSVGGAAVGISIAIVGFVYFVFCWSGGRRATLGQRIFHMQVGNAFDGAPLTVIQAVKRWLGYGLFLSLFSFTDAIYGTASLIQLVWVVVLLISIARSPARQGLHDRFANSAVVRPSGDSSNGPAMACLVIVTILVVLSFVALIAIILIGSQVSGVLASLGGSV